MRPQRYGSRRRAVQQQPGLLDDWELLDYLGLVAPMMPTALLGDPFSPTEAMAGEDSDIKRYQQNYFDITQGNPARYKDLPIFNPADYPGKTIAPIKADLTTGGKTYTGIDSSKIDNPVPMMGGPEYVVEPGRESLLFPEEAIANSKSNTTSMWASSPKKALLGGQSKLPPTKGGADFVTVHALSQDAHKSNQSLMDSTLRTVGAYVRDGRISPNDIVELNKLIRVQVPDFPGLEDPSSYEKTGQMTFDQRAKILNILAKPGAEKYNVPPISKILNETRSAEFHGTRKNQPMLVLKPHRDAQGNLIPLRLGRDTEALHNSYGKGFAGEVVGRFAAPVAPDALYPDFYREKRAAGKLDKNIDWELADRSQPVQTINQEVISRTRATPYQYIRSPRQAELAIEAGLGRFRDSKAKVDDGGVSPADFSRQLRSSPASAALTQYSEKDLNKKIKSGEMELFQLGKDSKIGFGLQYGQSYLNDYGFDSPVLSSDDVRIVSVFNNEPGASGVGGPGTMLKALSKGGNVLDAYAVPTPENPSGFLPKVYEKFGFSEVGRIPFSREFFIEDMEKAGKNGKQAYNDLVEFWLSTGWNPTMGEPDIVIMKYTGDPDVRSNPVREFFEQGRLGVRSGRTRINTAAVASVGGRVGGFTGDTVTGSNIRPDDPRIMEGRNPPASRGRFPALLDEIINLSNQDVYNLGLDKYDVKALRNKLTSLLF